MKKTVKNTLETIRIASGLLLFPFMGLIAAFNAMGFNSLMEVFTMF